MNTITAEHLGFDEIEAGDSYLVGLIASGLEKARGEVQSRRSLLGEAAKNGLLGITEVVRPRLYKRSETPDSDQSVSN